MVSLRSSPHRLQSWRETIQILRDKQSQWRLVNWWQEQRPLLSQSAFMSTSSVSSPWLSWIKFPLSPTPNLQLKSRYSKVMGWGRNRRILLCTLQWQWPSSSTKSLTSTIKQFVPLSSLVNKTGLSMVALLWWMKTSHSLTSPVHATWWRVSSSQWSLIQLRFKKNLFSSLLPH